MYAKIRSDYSPDTCLIIVMSEDGDISIKILGDGEMRIAMSGGHIHGKALCDIVNAFRKLMDVMDKISQDN